MANDIRIHRVSQDHFDAYLPTREDWHALASDLDREAEHDTPPDAATLPRTPSPERVEAAMRFSRYLFSERTRRRLGRGNRA